MENNLVVYKKHYQIFIKNLEEPLEMSSKNGEIFMKVLQDKDCPSFVTINNALYNRFEILRVVPYEETIPNDVAVARIESEERKKRLSKHLESQNNYPLS